MKKNIYTIIFISLVSFCEGQTWQWAKSGDSGPTGSEGYGVCMDKLGNIYITGAFNDPIITFGSYTLTNSGIGFCVFLTKYDSNGNVIWARNSISSSSDFAYSVFSDTLGNIYFTGYFSSTTIAFGSYTLTNTGSSNMFIAKYDSNGNPLWAKCSSGSSEAYGLSVCLDANGNSYVTGYSDSPTITFGSYTLTNSGTYDVFITKYDTNGNELWASKAIGSGIDYVNSVSVDAGGNAYIIGSFKSPTLAFGSYTLTNTGDYDVFIAKYDTNGNVMWAKNSTGSGDDEGTSICGDMGGNLYATGYFLSSTIAFGSYTLTNTGVGNVFLIKYDSNGNVIWAQCSTNTLGNYGKGFSVNTDANNIYLGGGFDSPIAFGSYTLTSPPGSPDPMFIVRYSLNGIANSAISLTSGGDDQNGIVVDKSCNAYIVGDFQGNPSSCIVGTTTLNSTGIENAFLAKLAFTCLSTSINELTGQNIKQNIYPNPNTGSFKLQIDNEIKNGEIILLNCLGQKVHEQKIIQGENNIITSGLAKGLYNYIILHDKEQISNGKLAID